MKLQFLIVLLLAPCLANADAFDKYNISVNDPVSFLKIVNLVMYKRLDLLNDKNEIKNPTPWQNKEIRYKAIECEIQELNQGLLKLFEENKELVSDRIYKEQTLFLQQHMTHIDNCEHIKSEDSRINWKTVEVIPNAKK